MRVRIGSPADLTAFLVCGIVASSILVTRVTTFRIAARQASCADHLKQIGIAVHNYHSAYSRLPMGCGGTSAGSAESPSEGNANRLSPLVGLLPFLEQQALWEQISIPYTSGDVTFPAMGPVPWCDPDSYKPWGQRPEVFVCPTDSADAQRFPTAANYAISYGDTILNVGVPLIETRQQQAEARVVQRGAFRAAAFLRFRDFLDGLSNTLLMSERRIAGPKVAKDVDGLARNPSRCVAAAKDPATNFWPEGREASWADGSLLSMGFQTILPPNSPSATTPNGRQEGVMSVSSNHVEGAHVLFADGRVMFATDTIDTGDSTSPSVALPRDGTSGYAFPGDRSPYGIWGALGTRAHKETIDSGIPGLIAPPPVLTEQQREELQSRPLQSWTFADGSSTFEARLIGVHGNSRAILITEEGETKAVPLSSLQSQDAYRAVAQFVEGEIQARESLLDQLEAGVRLLDDRKVDEFLRNHFAIELSERQTADISTQRGLLIHQLETAIREIKSPTGSVTLDDSGRIFRVQARGPAWVDLKFQRFDGRWKIVR